jgi:hypothetical protein
MTARGNEVQQPFQGPAEPGGDVRPGAVQLAVVLASLTAGAGVLVGATALVPWLITGEADRLVALVSLGVPLGLGVVAGVLRLRARRGRGVLVAAVTALALVGSAAAVLLAWDLGQVMGGVEGSFGGLSFSYLVTVLPLPLTTVVAVARPAVGRWLSAATSAPEGEAAPATG